MSKPKTTVDPLFAECARTAPRKDLEFYLLAASRADLTSFGRATPGAICQMASLYAELTGPKPGSTASQKRRAWQAIDVYKASLQTVTRSQPMTQDERTAHWAELDGAACDASWWPTDLNGAAIVRLALDVAARADLAEPWTMAAQGAPSLAALETLIEAVAADIGVEDDSQAAISA